MHVFVRECGDSVGVGANSRLGKGRRPHGTLIHSDVIRTHRPLGVLPNSKACGFPCSSLVMTHPRDRKSVV